MMKISKKSWKKWRVIKIPVTLECVECKKPYKRGKTEKNKTFMAEHWKCSGCEHEIIVKTTWDVPPFLRGLNH